MTKINNTQRAAFVAMLENARDKFSRSKDGRLYLNRYDFNPSRVGDSQLAALIKKHNVEKLKAASDAAEKAFSVAFAKVDAEVDAYNEQVRAKRETELEAFTDAIRDVWASEHVEEATAIVARLTKQ